jgi:hypothetical protein
VAILCLSIILILFNRIVVHQQQFNFIDSKVTKLNNIIQQDINYLINNYRNIVISLANNNNHIVINSMNIVVGGMDTCLYVMSKNKNNPELNFTAYLIVNDIIKDNEFDKLNILHKIINHLVLPTTIFNDTSLAAQCGFSVNASSYAISINLTSLLFMQLRMKSDLTDTFKQSNPGLSRLAISEESNEMYSNIYLDSISNESNSNTESITHKFSGIYFDTKYNKVSITADNNPQQNQLNINNAGIQAEYITPSSHVVNIGAECMAQELGKFVQQQSSSSYISSQLQCTYNPTFCNGSGYCYLPLKTTSFVYHYSELQSFGTCPRDTFVDDMQPAQALNTNITCPNVNGYKLINGVTGQPYNCYTSPINNAQICSNYKSICDYYDSQGAIYELAIKALQELRCSNNYTTYVINI